MALEAKNIYFRYNRKQSWILENRSISVEKEEHLAIFCPQWLWENDIGDAFGRIFEAC